MSYDMQKRATLRCMHLLEKRDYTEKELRDKLKNGKTTYTQEQIDGAIAYVAGYHYIDDERYAQKYINCMGTRKSHKQIEAELLRKGVDRDVIRNAFEEAEEVSEEEQIMNWLLKKGYDPAISDAKDKQKVFAFLMRKGFRSEDIRRAMSLEFG